MHPSLSPLKAKYYAASLRADWAFGERQTREALKAGQSRDAFPTNRIRLASQTLFDVVAAKLGLSDVRIVAVFPADERDKENLGLYRLEFYSACQQQARPAILMHELDEDVWKAADDELLDIVMTSKGL